MAKLGISTGTAANDGTGDSLLAGAVKVNTNFDEVYGIIGDGTNTYVGIVSSLVAAGSVSISTSYGQVTVTGLANTAVINAEQIYAGITTIGDSVVATANTFSDAGYFNPAGIVTAGSAVVNTSVVTAGVVTSSTLGVQVTGVVTATSFAVRGTGVDSWVGLNTITLDNTGIAATTITISDSATLTNATITTATITNLTATNVTGTAVTIGSAGIEVTGVGTFTGQIDANGGVAGDVTGNLTGTATTATLATNAQGLTGSPSVVCGIITGTNLSLTGGSGAVVAGVTTSDNFAIGANTVITSARKLSNIASLDATTTSTIEAAIEAGPNDFTDLNVAGLATVGQLYVDGRTNGLNIIGVCTGLSVPGITTLGIITGATSIQATDVYSNFLFGDGTNLTGVARTDNITTTGIATFASALNVTTSGISTVSGVLKVGVATITDLTVSGFTTATTFVGQLDSGIGTITKAFIGAGVTIDQKNIDAGQTGIVTAATFDGNLTGTPTLGTGVTVTTWGLEVLGVTTSNTFSGNVNAGVATVTTGTVTNLTATTLTMGAVTINATGINNTGTSTATNFVGDLTGNLIGTPTLGVGVTVVTGGNLEIAQGIVTATRYDGTKAIIGTGVTIDQNNIDDIGIASVRSDCKVGLSTAAGLVLTSANGTAYRLIVANDGTLSTTAV